MSSGRAAPSSGGSAERRPRAEAPAPALQLPVERAGDVPSAAVEGTSPALAAGPGGRRPARGPARRATSRTRSAVAAGGAGRRSPGRRCRWVRRPGRRGRRSRRCRPTRETPERGTDRRRALGVRCSVSRSRRRGSRRTSARPCAPGRARATVSGRSACTGGSRGPAGRGAGDGERTSPTPRRRARDGGGGPAHPTAGRSARRGAAERGAGHRARGRARGARGGGRTSRPPRRVRAPGPRRAPGVGQPRRSMTLLLPVPRSAATCRAFSASARSNSWVMRGSTSSPSASATTASSISSANR